MSDALDSLMARYQEQVEPLVTEYVEEWQSPIYQQPIDDDNVNWLPCRQQPALDFEALESALEISFHPSVKTFYGRWYAGDLKVEFRQDDEQHPISLLQVQGPEDAERLLQNLTGHVLMKRKLKQPITVFIGLAEEADDLLISIDNDSGEIGLEWIGKTQHQCLSSNLDEFLQQCSPISGENH